MGIRAAYMRADRNVMPDGTQEYVGILRETTMIGGNQLFRGSSREKGDVKAEWLWLESLVAGLHRDGNDSSVWQNDPAHAGL